MTPMGTIATLLEQKLRAAFAPSKLLITDESARHAGHTGAHPEGESHFSITIESAHFEGVDRLTRARLVHECLGPDLLTRIHALSLRLSSTIEAHNQKV